MEEVSHPPMIWVAMVPSLSARFQSSDQVMMSVAIRPSSIIRCHIPTARLVPSSLTLTVILVPSTVNGRPPACQISDSMVKISPASLMMW